MKRLLIAALLLVGMTVTPAPAASYTLGWVMAANANTGLGFLCAVVNGSIKQTACGLTASGNLRSAANAGTGMYAKNGGTGETGLGGAADPGSVHEIGAQPGDSIRIDFPGALRNAPSAAVTMAIGSAPTGEGWALCGCKALYTAAGASRNLSRNQGASREPSQRIGQLRQCHQLRRSLWGAIQRRRPDGYRPLGRHSAGQSAARRRYDRHSSPSRAFQKPAGEGSGSAADGPDGAPHNPGRR
jgi:hypothetical protein